MKYACFRMFRLAQKKLLVVTTSPPGDEEGGHPSTFSFLVQLLRTIKKPDIRIFEYSNFMPFSSLQLADNRTNFGRADDLPRRSAVRSTKLPLTHRNRATILSCCYQPCHEICRQRTGISQPKINDYLYTPYRPFTE